MAEKIDNMPGVWEPEGTSSSNITIFRAIALAVLTIGTFAAFLVAQYLVAALLLCFLIITATVLATRHTYEHVYRDQFDYLQAAKITTEVVLEIPHARTNKDHSSVIARIQTSVNPSSTWIALKDYQRAKVENQNTAIFGMSGSGKTHLLRCIVQQIEPSFRVKVLSFKRKDTGVYSTLGYEPIEMSLCRPDPWCNKLAFKRALLVAMDLDETRSITANSVRPLLKELIDEANSWDELFTDLRIAIKSSQKDNYERSIIQRGALIHIQETLKAIYDPKATYFDVTDNSQFLDFSKDDETQAKFDAEFYLDILYEKIVKDEIKDVVIVIDEASHLLRNKYDSGENVSIIEKLIAREIRATGSRLIMCTQLYTDISPGARDQFAAQYQFKTKDPDTLRALHAISELLDHAVATLDPYNFVDINQDFRGAKAREAVYHFKLFPRTIEPPRVAIELIAPKSLPPAQPIIPLPRASYLTRTLELLENGPMSTQEIATQFVIEEQRPLGAGSDWRPTSEQVSDMKLKIKSPLLQLLAVHDGGLVDVLLLQDEYRDKPKSLYFLKDKGDKRVHSRLCEITRRILTDHGVPKFEEGKDRVSESDFEFPNHLIEVETGLRRGNTKDLEKRIEETKAMQVIIVVPNDKARERYKSFTSNERVKVLVLYELGYHLDKLSAKVEAPLEKMVD